MKQTLETGQLGAMPCEKDTHRCLLQNSHGVKQVEVVIDNYERKLLSRLISRESSHVSSRAFYYDGAPRAVPFQWELQPGTPKHEFATSSSSGAAKYSRHFQPLTPPPSYSWAKQKSRSTFVQSRNHNNKSNSNKTKIISVSAALSKLGSPRKLCRLSPSSSLSSSLSSSTSASNYYGSLSPASVESRPWRHDAWHTRSGPKHLGFEDNDGDEQVEEEEKALERHSPISTLTLGRRSNFLKKLGGCYRWLK